MKRSFFTEKKVAIEENAPDKRLLFSLLPGRKDDADRENAAKKRSLFSLLPGRKDDADRENAAKKRSLFSLLPGRKDDADGENAPAVRNYNEYKPGPDEWAAYYAICGASLAILAYLFYKSAAVSLIFALASIPARNLFVQYKINAAKKELLGGFGNLLVSLSASFAAGSQMPTAMKIAANEALSDESDALMRHEAVNMIRLYEEGHAEFDELWKDLSLRSGVEEIRLFANAYSICRQSGGDVLSVSVKTSELILDRIEFANEMNSLMAEKKLDVLLLSAMPPAILLFLNIGSPSYLAPLYETVSGRLIMTAAFLLMGVSVLWSIRIMNIKI